ncbi:MAG: aminotransferase class IV [Bryobacterales bacterium]|nr:aminotransferase class IV [Bryobacterales bacterium]
MAEPIAYLRGRLMPAAEARLSIYDLGIVLGATVTDLLRTFRHQPYRLDDHVRRFYESCRYARLDPGIGPEETGSITRRIVEHNARELGPNEDLAVVYFITPGESPIYAGSAASAVRPEATFCIHSFPLPFALWRPFFTEGVHLVIPSTRHIPPQCVDPKVKNRSRMHWWLADQEARLADPRAIPLLLDLEGNLTETSGSNVLLVKNGVVLSPTPRNILLGVSRDTIRRICESQGIPFIERDLQVHDAINADEAFLATTPYSMAPVTRVNGLEIGGGKAGPVFEKILAQWSGEVGVDIRGQVVG